MTLELSRRFIESLLIPRPTRRPTTRRSFPLASISAMRSLTPSSALPPSQDLLASLHRHASTLLTASYNLLPPLTPLAPKHSPTIIAHFDALAALTAQEEAATIARSPREETLQKLRGKRIVQGEGVKSKSKSMLAGRREAWRDGEKAWEGSSLIAVGECESRAVDLFSFCILADLHSSWAMRRIGMFMQLLAAEVVSKALIEALPPDQLPPLPPVPQPEALNALEGEGARKRRRVDKGKGKARAEDEEEEEDVEMLQAQAMFDPLLMGLGRDGEVADMGEEGWNGSEWEL